MTSGVEFERCGNCRFYGNEPGTDRKVCKRFPPLPKWAAPNWLEWCGEYKRADVNDHQAR